MRAKLPPETGKGAVYLLLVEVAALPVDQRKAALVPRLEHLWNLALAKSYTNRNGDEIPCPDAATALRVVEVADAILCDVAEDKGNKFAVLRKFDTAPKKAAG